MAPPKRRRPAAKQQQRKRNKVTKPNKAIPKPRRRVKRRMVNRRRVAPVTPSPPASPRPTTAASDENIDGICEALVAYHAAAQKLRNEMPAIGLRSDYCPVCNVKSLFGSDEEEDNDEDKPKETAVDSLLTVANAPPTGDEESEQKEPK